MSENEIKKIENCDFNQFIKAVENVENEKNYSIDTDKIKEPIINKLISKMSKIHFKHLPRQNYHILGYITFCYLLYVIFASWDNKIDYGFYEVLRWLVTCFSGWTAYRIYNKNPQSKWLLVFSAITILFNPVVKVELDKDVWQTIDVVAASLFLIYGIKYRPKN